MTEYVKRRQFVKGAGAVGLAGGITSLSGCLGESGNGEPEVADKDTLSLVVPPLGYNIVALEYIQEKTNILDDAMEAVGYDYDITVSWDDSTLFAAGGADTVPTLGDIEAAQIATQRNLDLTMHGFCALNYEGIYVRRGEDLDPENTGSAEASVRKLVDEGRRFGNAGWGQGEVPAGQITFYDQFDLLYLPEGGDFDVFSTDWNVLPQLLIDGEVDMIVNAPPLGAASEVVKGDDSPIVDILWYMAGLEEAGLDSRTMNLGMWPTLTEFSDNHEDSLRAFMGAWIEGIKYLDDPSNKETIVNDEAYIQAFGANTADEARVILEFGQEPGSHQEASPGNNRKLMQTDLAFTDDFIETDKKALETVTGEPFNLIEDGWQEKLIWKKMDL